MLSRVRSVHTVLSIILCAALVISCGSDPDEAVSPVAETYILVIDWVLAEPQFAIEVEPDELPVVFVESLGPADIELVVQVAVVGHFIDTADIHFIDSRIEALEEIEGAPVRDGGLLVGLGGGGSRWVGRMSGARSTEPRKVSSVTTSQSTERAENQ